MLELPSTPTLWDKPDCNITGQLGVDASVADVFLGRRVNRDSRKVTSGNLPPQKLVDKRCESGAERYNFLGEMLNGPSNDSVMHRP